MTAVIKWEITPDGVTVNGVQSKRIGDLEAFQEYLGECAIESNIYGGLLVTKENFQAGRANYRNAYEQYRELYVGLTFAELTYKRLLARIDEFVDPPIAAAFGENWRDFETMVSKLVKVLDAGVNDGSKRTGRDRVPSSESGGDRAIPAESKAGSE